MQWRFIRRIVAGPFRFYITKKGVSVAVGGKLTRLVFSRHGSGLSFSLPGTGLFGRVSLKQIADWISKHSEGGGKQ